MKEKSIFSLMTVFAVLLIFLMNSAYAMHSCVFAGTVSNISGDSVEGTEVNAYLFETGELIATGQTVSAGYNITLQNTSTTYILLRVSGELADQNPQYCDGEGEMTVVNLTVTDADNDTYTWYEDCNDTNPYVNPGAVENCTNTIDDNCDGFNDTDDKYCTNCTDDDGDGYGNPASFFCNYTQLDCDDNNTAVNPGANETCDGIDNNCNDQIDEDYNETQTSCGVGECSAQGMLTCVNGTETDTCTPGSPTTEICDGKDNNCDSQIDEGGVCNTGGSSSSSSGGSSSGGGIGCYPNWVCANWSECVSSGIQTRICTDKNNCRTAYRKPAVEQNCTYFPKITAPEEYCGDKTCQTNETCKTCEEDCGICPIIEYCGDQICQTNETCETCEEDCGACIICGDGACNGEEDCKNCELDCGACQKTKPPAITGRFIDKIATPFSILFILLLLVGLYVKSKAVKPI